MRDLLSKTRQELSGFGVTVVLEAFTAYRKERPMTVSSPNLFLIYVTDVERATRFYSDLFAMTPQMTTPRYVSFEVAPGVLFALWSGRAETVDATAPRFSEVGLMVPGSAAAVDAIHDEWAGKGVTVVEAPHDEVFGRTFVVSDPDGNLIRVSPLD
ncbi:glyoxalase [Rhodococcus sp. BUPNP1]|nr:glyoxalase [Rhodococcus sp. BUPNP1]